MPNEKPSGALTKTHARINKVRKSRYRRDQGYRAEVCARSRESYRQSAGKDVLTRNCAEEIPTLNTKGRVRNVTCADGKQRNIRCLSLQELCDVLGDYSLDNVREWIYGGRFPGPIHHSVVDGTGKSKMGIYTIKEVRILLEVFSEQQQTKAYYTKADEGTKRALFARLSTVRKLEGYGTRKKAA